MMGRQRRSWEQKEFLGSRWGWRQNEVVEKQWEKGLKTSRKLEGEGSVKEEGEGVGNRSVSSQE